MLLCGSETWPTLARVFPPMVSAPHRQDPVVTPSRQPSGQTDYISLAVTAGTLNYCLENELKANEKKKKHCLRLPRQVV